MAIQLSGSIQRNRGDHPFVVVSEQDAAFRSIRSVAGKPVMGSSMSGGFRFHEPAAVIVNGVEYQATGVGAIFYEEETTRERNPRNGKVKVTTRRVENSGACYVYLAEPERAPVSTARTIDPLADLDEDERSAWGDFHSAARESRREDI